MSTRRNDSSRPKTSPRAALRRMAAAVVGLSLPAAGSAAGAVTLLSADGGWQVTFEAATSTLECRHAGSGASLKGRLSFAAELDGPRAAWTVQSARDDVPRRLALVDPRNDAQGYVTASGEGGRLVLTVLHRPPHNFPGELVFEPELRFGVPETFAVSGTPSE